MSYMDNAAFSPISDIQELSIDEIGEVGGGVPWLAIPIAIGLALLASEYLHHHT